MLHEALEEAQFGVDLISRISVEALVADKLSRRGLERVCEVTGEARRTALEADQTLRERFPAIAWTDAVRLRTLVAHAYHRVDAAILYAIVRDQFPPLIKAIEDTLVGLGEER